MKSLSLDMIPKPPAAIPLARGRIPFKQRTPMAAMGKIEPFDSLHCDLQDGKMGASGSDLFRGRLHAFHRRIKAGGWRIHRAAGAGFG